MNVDIGAQTDVGRARERNEDGYVVEEPLYAVADGMGGHRAGEVASRMALETIAEVPPDDGAHSLAERVRAANRVVHQRAAEDKDLEGMGTTLTALWMDGNEARIAHVGDSRAYLLREDTLKMLTEDHTLVQRMVREGKITLQEAEVHPQRSILTRALGVDAEVEVDDLTVELRPGDRLLMCTDGLTSMLGEDRIAETLRTQDEPQAAADALVDAANEAGGQDNITVLVIDLTADADASSPAGDQDGSGGSAAATVATALAAAGAGAAAAAAAAVKPAPKDEETTEEREAVEDAAPGAADTAVIRVQDTPPKASSDAWRADEFAARRGRGWIKWVVAAVVLLVALAVGGKTYIDRQWFVGVADERVAIFKGIPSDVLGLDLSTVVETTDLSADDAQQLSSWSELDRGIAVDDRADAEALIEQIRADLQGGQAEPDPSPSPTGSG